MKTDGSTDFTFSISGNLWPWSNAFGSSLVIYDTTEMHTNISADSLFKTYLLSQVPSFKETACIHLYFL